MTRRLIQVGAISGVIAAACTTAVAAIARAADVSLQVDGTQIPVLAFALWTLVGAAVGVALALVLRRRQRFVLVTVMATGFTLIPAVAVPDDSATKVVLVVTHLLAAAVIIPALARLLPAD